MLNYPAYWLIYLLIVTILLHFLHSNSTSFMHGYLSYSCNLCYSYSNGGSEPCLASTHSSAGSLAWGGQGSNPPSSRILVGFVTCSATVGTPLNLFLNVCIFLDFFFSAFTLSALYIYASDFQIHLSTCLLDIACWGFCEYLKPTLICLFSNQLFQYFSTWLIQSPFTQSSKLKCFSLSFSHKY